ncbi:HTH domain-containing protein [Natronorubrum sp. A-ect3]|uniref:HTH domain-containing protein n=1 Tax=Natronorubrum sp. A-ect3 TaxID=3242698 RepID=UPI00359D4F76
MPVSNYAATTPAVDLETHSRVRIECYVRSSIPPTVSEPINDVVERLQRLSEAGQIDTYQTTHWPPDHPAVKMDTATDDRPVTRGELVATFEQWARQHGHSLEPAFRRQEVQQAPLGLECDEPRERVRVPFVSLAIYEDDEGTDGETLRGVVPYTEQPQTADEQTYTVDTWLSAVEPAGADSLSHNATHDQPTRLEGQQ